MSDKLRAYLQLHFCVLIWGFTAILGKLITLKALPLVWWRVVICCTTLLLLVPRAQFKGIPWQTYKRMFGIGLIVGLHWLCFYGAIKLSNASVAVATMATASFFAAIAEPMFMRTRIKPLELSLGLVILPGMGLIVGNIDWHMRTGFLVGILSAMLAAIFSSLNKKLIDHNPTPPLVMSLTEMAGGVLVCSVLLPFFVHDLSTELLPTHTDWLWLFLLSWVCTLLPYALNLLALRHISAFAANLAVNLEPVYGIILAAILFQEHKDLKPQFYIGVLIILLAVFSHPLLKSRFDKA